MRAPPWQVTVAVLVIGAIWYASKRAADAISGAVDSVVSTAKDAVSVPYRAVIDEATAQQNTIPILIDSAKKTIDGVGGLIEKGRIIEKAGSPINTNPQDLGAGSWG
jgi:hypothetical protein